jgi:RNA polymerase sigma-70 factor (ECF subfamily)
LNRLPPEKETTKNKYSESHILMAVQETLNGNSRAFYVIVERYTPLFYSLAFRMLGRKEEAEEAVQEIFYKVLKSLKNFKLGKRFFPWIYTIALNHLRSRIKTLKRRSKTEVEYIEEESVRGLHNSGQNDPSRMIINKEALSLAKDALRMLKNKYREVFILREIEGLSVKEVSEILHKPEGTIKTNLYRAKKHLIELLTDKL